MGDVDDEEEDEELTSLAWLQDADLLKNINHGEDLCPSPTDDVKENNDINKGDYSNPPYPYNPQKHVNSNPHTRSRASYSWPSRTVLLRSYQWKTFITGYWLTSRTFKMPQRAGKTSVRHNLSLNKCFKKVDKEKGQVRNSLHFRIIKVHKRQNCCGRFLFFWYTFQVKVYLFPLRLVGISFKNRVTCDMFSWHWPVPNAPDMVKALIGKEHNRVQKSKTETCQIDKEIHMCIELHDSDSNNNLFHFHYKSETRHSLFTQ